jgi:hypothetical protein
LQSGEKTIKDWDSLKRSDISSDALLPCRICKHEGKESFVDKLTPKKDMHPFFDLLVERSGMQPRFPQIYGHSSGTFQCDVNIYYAFKVSR